MIRMKRTRAATTDTILPTAGARVKRSRGGLRVVVEVSAQATQGSVSADDLAAWVRHAIADYHRFRNGWIAEGKIRLPEVEVVEP